MGMEAPKKSEVVVNSASAVDDWLASAPTVVVASTAVVIGEALVIVSRVVVGSSNAPVDGPVSVAKVVDAELSKPVAANLYRYCWRQPEIQS